MHHRQMWRLEDGLQECVLPSYHVGSRGCIQAGLLGGPACVQSSSLMFHCCIPSFQRGTSHVRCLLKEYVQQIQGRGYPRQEGGSGNSTHVLSIIPESLIIFKILDEARCDGLCL